jgi:hypothetical protein
VVTFDERITIESGKAYGLRFRVPENARSFSRAVDPATPPGDYTQLPLVGDLSLVAEGVLFAFGMTNQESAVYRVKGIRHQKDLVATLTLVDDAPEISQADQGEIPEYKSNVTIPADPYTLAPRDLKYHERIDVQGQVARALVLLTWQVPRFGNIFAFQVQRKDDDGGGPWETVATVAPPRRRPTCR